MRTPRRAAASGAWRESRFASCQACSSRLGRPVPTLALHPGHGHWAAAGSHWHSRRLELWHARRGMDVGEQAEIVRDRQESSRRRPCPLPTAEARRTLPLPLTYSGSRRWSVGGFQAELAADGVFQHLFGRADLGIGGWRMASLPDSAHGGNAGLSASKAGSSAGIIRLCRSASVARGAPLPGRRTR
jgi:hypothetical protein